MPALVVYVAGAGAVFIPHEEVERTSVGGHRLNGIVDVGDGDRLVSPNIEERRKRITNRVVVIDHQDPR